MARNGSLPLDNATVVEVTNSKTGRSRVIATKGGVTITVEKSGPFPDGMNLRPDDTVDVLFTYDPTVKQ